MAFFPRLGKLQFYSQPLHKFVSFRLMKRLLLYRVIAINCSPT